ncbi:MAG: hypothetical protein WCI12_04595 [Actinomycetes bacterium]
MDDPLTTQTPTPHRIDHLDLFEAPAVFTMRAVTTVSSRPDLNDLLLGGSTEIALSEIGVVTIETMSPFTVHTHQPSRIRRSVVLTDEATTTAAAGIVGPPALLEKS